MPRRKMSGLDEFLHTALSEDGEFRKLFWKEVAKVPAPSRRKLEAGLKNFPR
mgnify:CR=1 FL=1